MATKPLSDNAQRTRSFMLSVGSLAIFLVFWQLASIAVASPFFPSVMAVIEAFDRLIRMGDTQGISMLTHSWASLYRVLLGFVIGVVLGVPRMGFASWVFISNILR